MTSDGQLLIGSSVAPYISATTLTAGSNVVITNGHNSIEIAASMSGIGFTLVTQVFTSNGTYTPTADMAYVEVEIVGGGGAGGGAANTGSGERSAGAGGGAGEYARGVFSSATIGASQAVTVGAGGTGVSGSTGNTGGTTSLGALITAVGGTGGQGTGALGSGASNVLGGAGGTGGSGGSFRTNGGVGGSAYVSLSGEPANFSGYGGCSYFGGGGQNKYRLGADGNAGTPYGSGGGGAVGLYPNGAQTGGAGKAGVVIIKEYIAT